MYYVKDGQGRFQRSKFLLLYSLETLHLDTSATAAELFTDICALISEGAVRACAARMNTGYCGPNLYYHRHYIRRIAYTRPAVYRIKSKGKRFVSRMFKQRPGDCTRWLTELSNAREERTKFQEWMRTHYKKVDAPIIKGIKDGNKKGLGPV